MRRRMRRSKWRKGVQVLVKMERKEMKKMRSGKRRSVVGGEMRGGVERGGGQVEGEKV